MNLPTRPRKVDGENSPCPSQGVGRTRALRTRGTGPSRTDAVGREAGEVAKTAKAEAGNVVETAKDEAAGVAAEAKSQITQVYGQTKQELTDQAAQQQQRVADGLRSIGDELTSLANGAENPGIATDLVRQASTRVSGASDWLSQRDPGSLLHEVKTYARRKPGVFIAGALIAGVVAGRLTRALAESAKDEHAASAPTHDTDRTPVGGPSGIPAAPSAPTPAPIGATPAVAEPTPLSDRSRPGTDAHGFGSSTR